MAGADASLVYKISANLEELKAKLLEGKNLVASVNADVRQMTGNSSAAIGKTGDEIDKVGTNVSKLRQGFSAFNDVAQLTGVNVGADVAALENLATIGLRAAGSMGGLAVVGPVLAAALTGIGIGRISASFFDLDEKVGNLTAKLLGWGDAAGERAAAAADTLARASALAGVKVTDMDVAITLLSGAAAAHARAMTSSAAEIEAWNASIAKVKSEGNMDALTADLNSQNFSLDELAKRYGTSVQALQYFQREQKKAADAEADSAKVRYAAITSALKAESDLQHAKEAVAEAYDHVNLAQGKYVDVLSRFDPTLIANVQHWKDLGASVQDISVILDVPPAKIQSITDALEQQTHALDDVIKKMAELDAAAKKRNDEADQDAADTMSRFRKSSNPYDTSGSNPLAPEHKAEATYDLTTELGLQRYKRENGAATFREDDQTIIAQAKAGWTLQDFITAGIIDPYGWWKEHPLGSLVGLFADGVTNLQRGGMALVGERGPEIVRLPAGADVIPNHELGATMGAGVVVHVHGNVYGSGGIEELARQIGDAHMRNLQGLGERFPVTLRSR